MQSNPIQQRIERLAERWNKARSLPGVRMVRLGYRSDEKDMIDVFFDYMLGLEGNLIDDIPFLFDEPFRGLDTFSEALLIRTEENIRIWNESQKADALDFVPVNWTRTRDCKPGGNRAEAFAADFNRLVSSLELDSDTFVVLVLNPGFVTHRKDFAHWIIQFLECPLDPQLRLLVPDSLEHPLLDEVIRRHGPICHTMAASLDMGQALQQVAAMGQADEPSTGYRVHFVRMMNAMKEDKEQLVIGEGTKCLEIAAENVERDGYWLTQQIVIHAAWSNYALGRKEYKQALHHIDHAVAVAETLHARMADETTAQRYMAQTYMQKAVVYYAWHRWEDACHWFRQSADLYIAANDAILAVEACRMEGLMAQKSGRSREAITAFVRGARTGAQIPASTIRGTSYAALIESLLGTLFEDQLPATELQQMLIPLYGPDWRTEIANWKRIPEPVNEPIA